jgi:hypothetical protein
MKNYLASPEIHRLLKSTVKPPFNTYLGTSFLYLKRKMLNGGCGKLKLSNKK